MLIYFYHFQEQVSTLDIGCTPRSMWVTLEDNIVGTCKPGDDIVVWFVYLFTLSIFLSNLIQYL